MKQIKYTLADKFINVEDYIDTAPFTPENNISVSYGYFTKDGVFCINKGFLFSANFPAINTKNSRRGALIHDFFYELIKDGQLSRKYRKAVDNHFHTILIEDGMSAVRAGMWLKAVRLGGTNALNTPKPKIEIAPGEPEDPLPAGWQVQSLLQR